MKSFARHRNAKGKGSEVTPDGADAPALLDLDDLDVAPLGVTAPLPAARPATTAMPAVPTAPIAPAASIASAPSSAENDDFVERLGDLDRFIGGSAPAAPASWTPPPPARPARPTAPAPPSLPRNVPLIPPPALAPISHPRPAPPVADHADWDPSEVDGDDDFVARLGDLDRFIGGTPAPAAAPAATTPAGPTGAPAADHEAEAQEFLDRLSDLDRFIGGPSASPKPPAPPSS